MANRVDPDQTARYEPSHLDVYCLLRYAEKKGKSFNNGVCRLQMLAAAQDRCKGSLRTNAFHCKRSR